MNDLKRLQVELEMNKAINPSTKGVIIAWMNRAYELGLKEAGVIIGEKLGEHIRNLKGVSKK